MDRHDALVQSIYDAATDTSAWLDVPARIAEDFGVTSVLIADGRTNDPTSFCINSFRFDDRWMVEEGFSYVDHFNVEINLGYRAALTAPLARHFNGHQYLEVANKDQAHFYDSCFARNKTPFIKTFAVNRDREDMAGGFVTYGEDFDPFHGENDKRLDTVLAHLRRSVEIRSKLNIAHRATATLGRQLDNLNLGVFLVDRTKRVLYHNQVAEDLARPGQGIALRTGVFRVTSDKVRRKLDERLNRVADTTDHRVEGPLQIPRNTGEAPLMAWVYPTIGFGVGELPSSAYACIVIRDLASEPKTPEPADLETALGLTPAEARVASLTPRAMTVAQMARHLGISTNTVKTHLSHVRGKLGARSTAEVAQVISKLET